jgi:hypothetical protein
MPDSERDTPKEVKIEMKWGCIDDTPTVYANQLLITHAGPEFYLIFGEIVPVNVDNLNAIPQPLSVKPKIKIAISREIMSLFIDAINDNFEKFSARVNTEVAQHDSSGS